MARLRLRGAHKPRKPECDLVKPIIGDFVSHCANCPSLCRSLFHKIHLCVVAASSNSDLIHTALLKSQKEGNAAVWNCNVSFLD